MMIKRNSKINLNTPKGFSLVEAVIVIAVIVAVVAIAIPAFQKYAINGNLRAAARDIIGDFSNLKQRAMAENTTFTITFNVADNNYTVPGLADPKNPAYFGSGIRLTGAVFGGGSSITFQRRGTASAGTVTLTNSRGSTATITTNITGRTHVQYNMY